MNDPEKNLQKLLKVAQEVESSLPTEAPFGFAARVVSLVKAESGESPLMMVEFLVRRAATAAFVLALGVAAVGYFAGLPKVELNVISRPYATVLSLAE